MHRKQRFISWSILILKYGILSSLVFYGCSIAIMTYIIANLLFSQSSDDVILNHLLQPCLMIMSASVLLWSVNTFGNQGLYYHKHPEKARFFASEHILRIYLIINSLLAIMVAFSLFLAVYILSYHDFSSSLTSLYHKFVADTFNIFFFTTDTNGN